MSAFVSAAARVTDVSAASIQGNVALILNDEHGRQLGAVTLDTRGDVQKWQRALDEADRLLASGAPSAAIYDRMAERNGAPA